MYQLLPQLVARDQEGVGEAVAAHFATAHAWDHVLRARVRHWLVAGALDTGVQAWEMEWGRRQRLSRACCCWLVRVQCG